MISVVIPTRNRAVFLDAALKSLATQEFPSKSFEVLVINNSSTDQTALTLDVWSEKMPNLRHFHETEPGLHAGRHRGLFESQGEVLVFADDDIEALPTWLSTVAEGFTDPALAMMGGNNLPLFLQPPPSWLDDLWMRDQGNGSRSLPLLSIQERLAGRYQISPYQVWGCNFAIRKEVLLAAGGFHPDGMPRELIRFRGDGETHVSHYVAEKGLQCLFDSQASVYHKVTPERMTFGYFRQRGFDQGISDSFTLLRGEAVTSVTKHSAPYRLARWGWRTLRSLWSGHSFRRDSGEQMAISEFETGHREGFLYHQAMYRDDPDIRKWVHRDRYF